MRQSQTRHTFPLAVLDNETVLPRTYVDLAVCNIHFVHEPTAHSKAREVWIFKVY